jgi:YCII-related domain-containing protein
MSKFVFVYRGGKPGATPEEQDKVMAAWGKWFGELGDALVDGGNPFGPPKSVTSSGTRDGGDGQPASGFSIVNAKDQAEAAELAKGCPVLAGSPGSVVEVYEAFPM